jgi:hypothetical protein
MTDKAFDKIARHLQSLKLVPLGGTFGSGESTVRDFELEEHVRLPDVYRAFLLAYGASTFENGAVFHADVPSPMADPEGAETFGSFFGLRPGPCDIRLALQRYRGRIPDSMLPIGDLPGGDLLCISWIGADSGAVFRWSHDDEHKTDAALHRVSNAFDEFVLSVSAKPPLSVDLAGVKLKLSPDLLARTRDWKAKHSKKS